MTDFRTLCQELMDAIDSGIPCGRIKQSPLAVRVDATLAQPEPQGPTDEELCEIYRAAYYACDNRQGPAAQAYALRAVLERWGCQ